MSNIIINDILDELREENNRLFDENKVFHNLLDKYRKCLINFQNVCECNQKLNNQILVDSLEGIYKTSLNLESEDSDKSLKDTNKRVINECIEDIEIQFIRTQELNQNKAISSSCLSKVLKNNNKNNGQKVPEDKDSDNEVSDQNDSQSEEEVCNDFFQCLECDLLFATKLNLKNHKLIHRRTGQPSKMFTCNYRGCEKSFTRVRSMRRHIQRKHTFVKPFKCDKCFKGFIDSQTLKSHQKVHLRPDIIRPFVCKYSNCDKNYVQKSSLIKHIQKSHTKDRPFRCKQCIKSYFTEQELTKHEEDHNREEIHTCDKCHTQFKLKSNLDKHKELMHLSDSVAFKCNDCSFETKFEVSLKAHITSFHTTTEKTFECDYEGCHKLFRDKYRLSAHKRTAHSIKRFGCEWPGCDYITHSRDSFKDHKRSHIGAKDFKCDFEGCTKTFVRIKGLYQHRKIHLKRFACSWPECGQRFSEEVYLTAHTNKHLNYRPFKCCFNGCNKDFKIDRHLKHHIRVVHKIKPKDLLQ